MYGAQIYKEDCFAGPYCPGSPPIPSASVGHRILEVALKLYSNSTMSNNVHYLWFRFFDANTNQSINNVSFFLTMNKNNDTLFHELLYTPTGTLVLQVNAINTPFNNTVYADREPVLGGWVQHNDEPIVVYAPIFNDANSTYHMNIAMYTIDYVNNIFDSTDNPQSVPNFNFYVNMKEQNQILVSPNVSVPEFPFAIPVLLIGITSLIVLLRINLRNLV